MESMCRICSNNHLPTFDMFLQTFLNHPIAFFVNRYLYLKVKKEDKLPHTICAQCFEKIKRSYNSEVSASLIQKKLALVAAEEDAKKPTQLADEENVENLASLAAEKKAENLLKTVEDNGFPRKTLNQSPIETGETPKKKFLILGPSGKKKVISVRVPKSFASTSGRENVNADESHGVKEGNTTDNTVSKMEVATSSDHPSDSIIEISNTFLSGNNNQTEGNASVIKTEINELSVTKLSDDTPKEKSEEQNNNKLDVNYNFYPKSFSDDMEIYYNWLSYSDLFYYKCPHCNCRNVTNYLIQQHINLCRRNTRHQCNICKRVFLKKYLLFRHMFNHSEKKRYLCKECNRALIL